jgi:exonuclease SbcC
MRIKHIRIQNYGPIKDLSLTPGDFEVIFGLNEAGKTALVEVLVYLLFRKTAVNLRYDKTDDMVLEVEDNGRSLILPAKKLSVELPAGDVANLMYVQASESRLYSSRGEAGFWDGMKSMLSKVGSDVPFTKLDTQIFEAVGLQPRKEEWKRDKQLVIENETRRKKALGEYLIKIGEIGKKENELADLAIKGESLKNKLQLIDQHKGFREYQELRRLYNAYQETQTGCQLYERYKYEYLTAWQKLDVERRTRSDEGIKLDEIEKEKVELEKQFEELTEIDRHIESEGLRSAVSYIKGEPSSPSLLFPLFVTLIALISTILSLLTPLPLLPSVTFLIGAIFTLFLFIRRRNLVRKIAVEKLNWLAKAKRVFPDVGSLTDLPERIEKIQEEKIRKKTAIQEKSKTIEQLTNARSLELIDGEIAELRGKTGLAELADLEKKLAEKQRLETELQKLAASLSQRLHESDARKWERMIKEYQVKQPSSDIDLETEKGLRREQTEMQQLIDRLTKDIRLFRDVEQAKVGIVDDREAFGEYEMLERKLHDYEIERDAALAAREILGNMSKQLDEFIGAILHGEEGLSEYFSTVTDHYAEVRVEKRDFHVVDKKGNTFSLENLSSGTQDQLLLCFRMAALRKAYPKGVFLILDDAFIFADWQRRKRLAQLLKKFVEQGNQVIYLTSDDHTRDLFSEHGAKITSLA